MQKPKLRPIHFWVRRILRLDLRFPCFVLSENPLILISQDRQGLHFFLPYLKGHKRVWIFVRTSWTFHSDEQIKAAKKAVALAAKTGNVNICYLANSEDEYKVCERHGIYSIICSSNCFVDENIFKINALEKKRFIAIYDARLSPFKRHKLAALVENLALITYRMAPPESQDYIENTRKLLKNATWLNDPFSPGYRFLSATEVSEYLNQAKVGLILSEKEGQNYASIQYLLCGLPVVSTMSYGGRDVFFDPDYVAIVDDTPEAVAQGVKRMCNLEISSEEIRQRTLLKIKDHRNYLIRACQEIYNETGCDEDFSEQFKSVFTHKFHGNLTMQEFRKLVN